MRNRSTRLHNYAIFNVHSSRETSTQRARALCVWLPPPFSPYLQSRVDQNRFDLSVEPPCFQARFILPMPQGHVKHSPRFSLESASLAPTTLYCTHSAAPVPALSCIRYTLHLRRRSGLAATVLVYLILPLAARPPSGPRSAQDALGRPEDGVGRCSAAAATQPLRWLAKPPARPTPPSRAPPVAAAKG